MQIKIAERLHPFSHRPGTALILPGTSLRLQIFPACVRVDDLSEADPVNLSTIFFDIRGPLEDFTIVQDLEKGNIRVWGWSSDGYFCYRMAPLKNEPGIIFNIEKTPQAGVACLCSGLWQLRGSLPAKSGDSLVLIPKAASSSTGEKWQMPLLERLSLGNHKAQDWDLIKRREDFTEIFPLWHRLGLTVPPQVPSSVPLLENCQHSLERNSPEHILPQFYKLFLAGFEGLLVPRRSDTDFQGITEASKEMNGSPLFLLTQGAHLIRFLFVQGKQEELELLPSLPPEFHCGRFIHVKCENFGVMSMEWTKKSLRRIVFQASVSRRLFLKFCQGEKRCRLRLSESDRGAHYLNEAPLDVVAGQNYWFDNFER